MVAPLTVSELCTAAGAAVDFTLTRSATRFDGQASQASEMAFAALRYQALLIG